MTKKRIALLVAQGDEEYQSEFITGFLKEAGLIGFDVFVFSMFIKYQNTRGREIGDSNIYGLINYDRFDAVAVMMDSIQTPGVAGKLEAKIKECFSGPVVLIDRQSKDFPVIWTDGYDLIYNTVSHLIEVHGFKDIGFLTGKKWHPHSITRVRAYRKAMEDHGLTVREDRLFDGDFWYTSGALCAEKILRNRNDMPEAIACANDCMAIGLCEALTRKGVRIPEDIAVTGYGSGEEGQTSPQPLTSPYIPSEYYGGFAVDALVRLFEGKDIGEPHPDINLFIGSSCGCEYEDKSFVCERRDSWGTSMSDEGYYSIFNYLMDDMMEHEELDSFLDIVFSYIYQLGDIDSFHLCLNSELVTDDEMNVSAGSDAGYSESMLHAIEYHKNLNMKRRVGTDVFFNSEDMLPVSPESDEPVSYFFLPVHFGSRSYGYAVLSYGSEARSYDEVARLWIKAVSRGLEMVRRAHINKKGLVKGADVVDYKTPEKVAAGAMLSDADKENMALVQNILDNNLLTYHFQPIVNVKDGTIYSYEALMRSDTEKMIAPLDIIKYAYVMGRLSEVEKHTFFNVLSRMETDENLKESRVFVNSIPGCKLSGEDATKVDSMMRRCGERLIVELTEQAEIGDEELDELKDRCKSLGVGMAVDDYGTGYSNISNLLRYMPNYVKIDRSLLSDIHNSNSKQHFVKSVIDFCHHNNIMALAEGVETSEELHTVILLGADLIQGFYTAKPSAEVKTEIDGEIAEEIKKYYKEYENGEGKETYVAGRTNRVMLSNLERDGVGTILVTNNEVTYRDITIVGTPGVKSGIHVNVQNGYTGIITLENAYLSTRDNHPVIKLEEEANVIIVLVGDNHISGGGIRVPEGSRIYFEGDGNLTMNLTGDDYYGIGGGVKSHHGSLEFFQDGKIEINSNGKNGIGIGSGLGGTIKIAKGGYSINLNGDNGVAIGSFDGNSDIEIANCEVNTDILMFNGVGVGSLGREAKVQISKASLKCYIGGRHITAVGTLGDGTSDINIEDSAINLDIGADNSSALGSVLGSSGIRILRSSLKVVAKGKVADTFGGSSENTDLYIHSSDINLLIDAPETTSDTRASDENVKLIQSRYRAEINGKSVQRTIKK
ncbi:MAG: EAL domain-containing protein [Eubacterium sp.]|nr:EAL domain-containing protein [Eubacterium sp.]